MELILVRHTEVLNPCNLCYGRAEIELSAEFLSQSSDVLQTCKGFLPEAVISSPSLRCTKLATRFKLPVKIDLRLAELDFGLWEGIPWNSLEPDELQYWMDNFVSRPAPGGESYLDLSARVLEFIGGLKNSGLERVLVITHGGPLRAIIASFLDISLYNSFELPIPYGAVFKLSLYTGYGETVDFLRPTI